jgi:hypothetical protein
MAERWAEEEMVAMPLRATALAQTVHPVPA